MPVLRAIAVLSTFVAITLLLIPVQAVLNRLPGDAKRRMPYHYHRLVVWILGIKIRLSGDVPADGPVLMVSNHQSWIDIPALSAVTPLSFISKAEVSRWPFFGTLARLQRTVFIERADRRAVDRQNNKIAERLARNDRLVLFAEGTSSDGNRVLPFKTALFAAARANNGVEPQVQAVSIAYTRVHGLPMGRQFRPYAAWYGDMELVGHLWEAVCLGPLDCAIHFCPPVRMSDFSGRKMLARHIQRQVTSCHRALLREETDRTNGAPPALDTPSPAATLITN